MISKTCTWYKTHSGIGPPGPMGHDAGHELQSNIVNMKFLPLHRSKVKLASTIAHRKGHIARTPFQQY